MYIQREREREGYGDRLRDGLRKTATDRKTAKNDRDRDQVKECKT